MRAWLWLALAASVALLAYQQRQNIQTTVEDLIMPRGIRNNNPGNIRHSNTQWQGMASEQTDAAFVQFVSPEYGIRALSKLLGTYSNMYNLHTVRGIVERFAPSNENDTAAYVQSVAAALGVDADSVINVAFRKADLVAAITLHENGQQPYDLATINAGIMLA